MDRAIAAQDGTRLYTLMRAPKSYVRQRTARALRRLTREQAGILILERTLECVEDRKEADVVRAECARTLAHWGVDEAAPAIVASLQDLDGDARYWAASALKDLRSPEARAELYRLRDDVDLFLSTAARQWTE